MLRAAERIGAAHTVFEHAEEIFDSVCGLTVRANPLAALFRPSVVDGLMPGELFTDVAIEKRFIGMQFGLARSVGNEEFADGLQCRALDVNRAGLSAGFNQGNDLLFIRMALLVTLRALRCVAV